MLWLIFYILVTFNCFTGYTAQFTSVDHLKLCLDHLYIILAPVYLPLRVIAMCVESIIQKSPDLAKNLYHWRSPSHSLGFYLRHLMKLYPHIIMSFIFLDMDGLNFQPLDNFDTVDYDNTHICSNMLGEILHWETQLWSSTRLGRQEPPISRPCDLFLESSQAHVLSNDVLPLVTVTTIPLAFDPDGLPVSIPLSGDSMAGECSTILWGYSRFIALEKLVSTFYPNSYQLIPMTEHFHTCHSCHFLTHELELQPHNMGLIGLKWNPNSHIDILMGFSYPHADLVDLFFHIDPTTILSQSHLHFLAAVCATSGNQWDDNQCYLGRDIPVLGTWPTCLVPIPAAHVLLLAPEGAFAPDRSFVLLSRILDRVSEGDGAYLIETRSSGPSVPTSISIPEGASSTFFIKGSPLTALASERASSTWTPKGKSIHLPILAPEQAPSTLTSKFAFQTPEGVLSTPERFLSPKHLQNNLAQPSTLSHMDVTVIRFTLNGRIKIVSPRFHMVSNDAITAVDSYGEVVPFIWPKLLRSPGVSLFVPMDQDDCRQSQLNLDVPSLHDFSSTLLQRELSSSILPQHLSSTLLQGKHFSSSSRSLHGKHIDHSLLQREQHSYRLLQREHCARFLFLREQHSSVIFHPILVLITPITNPILDLITPIMSMIIFRQHYSYWSLLRKHIDHSMLPRGHMYLIRFFTLHVGNVLSCYC